MKKFSYTRQLDAMDCGPASLKMVAEHYGRHYSLDTLREETFIGREGGPCWVSVVRLRR